MLQGKSEALALAACLNEPPPPAEDCDDDAMDTEAAEAGGGAGSSQRWRTAGYTCAEEAARWRQVMLKEVHSSAAIDIFEQMLCK